MPAVTYSSAAVGYSSPAFAYAFAGVPVPFVRRPDLYTIELLVITGEFGGTPIVTAYDLSDDVRVDQPIRRSVGRSSAVDDVQPGTLSFTLDNFDGKYTPDSPLAAAPFRTELREGARIRAVLTYGGTNYTRFNGVVTAISVSFPDDNSSTGTVTITCMDRLGSAALNTVGKWVEAVYQAAEVVAVDPPNTNFPEDRT